MSELGETEFDLIELRVLELCGGERGFGGDSDLDSDLDSDFNSRRRW